MTYRRVSPEGRKDPWFQDERTGMFFQFLSTDWTRWQPPTPAEVARDIVRRYGSPLGAYESWIGRTPNWYNEETND